MRGQCGICRCSGDSCRLEDGDKCCWTTDEQNLCSNPKCITAADVEKKRGRRATEQTRREKVKPIREAWQQTRAKWRSDADKRRRRKAKGRAA